MGEEKLLEVTMPCARWWICQQRKSPFWNLSSVISTTMTAVALCSFHYPKIRRSELFPAPSSIELGGSKCKYFESRSFWKSVWSCWNSILSFPDVVSHQSDKRADSLGTNSCSKTRKGVSPSSQPIPFVAPVFKNENPKRWAPNFWLY